jgi:hypothetical protein
VYDTAVAPMVASFLEGYNCCVLAYGQTSSGKTFTSTRGVLVIRESALEFDGSTRLFVLARPRAHISAFMHA